MWRNSCADFGIVYPEPLEREFVHDVWVCDRVAAAADPGVGRCDRRGLMQGRWKDFEADVEADLEELRQEGVDEPSPQIRARAESIAREVAREVATVALIRWVTFVEEDGSIALVLRGDNSRRRANIRVVGDGTGICVYETDENLRQSARHSTETAMNLARRTLAWLQHKSVFIEEGYGGALPVE